MPGYTPTVISTVRLTLSLYVAHGVLLLSLSTAWGGRASDVEMVRASDIMTPKNHQPRDQLLADRGFTLVEERVVSCRAESLIPRFTKGKNSYLPKMYRCHVISLRFAFTLNVLLGHLLKHLDALQSDEKVCFCTGFSSVSMLMLNSLMFTTLLIKHGADKLNYRGFLGSHRVSACKRACLVICLSAILAVKTFPGV